MVNVLYYVKRWSVSYSSSVTVLFKIFLSNNFFSREKRFILPKTFKISRLFLFTNFQPILNSSPYPLQIFCTFLLFGSSCCMPPLREYFECVGYRVPTFLYAHLHANDFRSRSANKFLLLGGGGGGMGQLRNRPWTIMTKKLAHHRRRWTPMVKKTLIGTIPIID